MLTCDNISGDCKAFKFTAVIERIVPYGDCLRRDIDLFKPYAVIKQLTAYIPEYLRQYNFTQVLTRGECPVTDIACIFRQYKVRKRCAVFK